MIIREFFHLVKEGEMDPLLYIKFCENLLTKESNICLINKVIRQTISIINDYIPINNRTSQKQYLFKLLSEKYFKRQAYEKYLLKNMTNFLLDLNNPKDPDNIKFLLEICLEISIEDVNDSDHNINPDENMDNSKRYDLPNLDLRTKERLIEAIFESDRFTDITKESLKRKILLENNKNNPNFTLSDKTLETCSLINKEESFRNGLWKLFVYKEKLFSDEQISAYMKGFNRELIKFPATKSKESNIKIYFKKRFFKDFPYVNKNHAHEYAVLFYENLRPNFLIEEKILKKFIKLKSKLNFDEHPNTKLKFLIENDINELKHKLLVIKSYTSLQLTGLKQSTFRKI
jgi:hypothetical protein